MCSPTENWGSVLIKQRPATKQSMPCLMVYNNQQQRSEGKLNPKSRSMTPEREVSEKEISEKTYGTPV